MNDSNCELLARAEAALRAAQKRIEQFEAVEDTHFLEAGDCFGVAEDIRAALSRTDDRLREALASIAETMPGRTHKEASAQRREIARTALETPAKGEGE